MYFKRHSEYPYEQVPDHFPFRDRITRNLPITEKDLCNYPLEIWAQLKFKKVLEFDYCSETIDLVKDSAICHPRRLWFSDYDHCAFKNLYGKSKPPSDIITEKRTIIRFLKGKEKEPEIKVREVDIGFLNVEEDSIAVLCPKERELTTKSGRPFLKQTYIQRLKQTLVEDNVKNKIMTISTDQMMTISELEGIRRQQIAIKCMLSGHIMVNLDFSKWNMRFRHETLREFGHRLDQLFGLNSLFRDEHLWYLSCIFLSNSRMCPPDYSENGQPLNGLFCRRGHLGGCEGMNQKKWTLFTQCAIRSVALEHKIRIILMGQGDNQVLILKLTRKQRSNWKIVVERFIDDLGDFMISLGLDLYF